MSVLFSILLSWLDFEWLPLRERLVDDIWLESASDIDCCYMIYDFETSKRDGL